ncbi:MAG: hypothetical protein AAFN77_01060 [Planctomycetota bacterium]
MNAALLAALILFGFLFSVLFLIWLTTIVDFSRPTDGPMVLAIDEPGDEKPEGETDDVLEPGVEEFPEVETPQLAQALEAVTDAVSSVRASLEKRSGSAAVMGRGRGFGSRDGGPGSGGDGIPEHKRWKISYEASDIDTYAQQLSFLQIDLGVVNETKQEIVRIADPGGTKSKTNTTREEQNKAKALFFMHEKQRMKRWDVELCTQSGVQVNGAFTVQFYTEHARNLVRVAEAAKLKGTGKTVVDVQKTFLKVVPDGNGFKFEVTNIEYR